MVSHTDNDERNEKCEKMIWFGLDPDFPGPGKELQSVDNSHRINQFMWISLIKVNYKGPLDIGGFLS